MQENERLRMALFDAQAALEALPPSESAGAEEKKPVAVTLTLTSALTP